MAEGDDTPIVPGHGKNGKPFKPNNTDENGDYRIGRGRTDPKTQFAKDDGRKRGRRPKGTRNLQTDWQEELAEMMEITEGGVRKRVTKQRGIVKATAARAMKRSDRAAEIAFRHAGERDERAGQVRLTDREIVERWLAGRGAPSAQKICDDADREDFEQDHEEPPPAGGDDGEGAVAS